MAPNQNGPPIQPARDEDSSLVQSPADQIFKDRPSNDTYGVRPGEKPYKMEIVWRNVLLFIYLHCAALYAFTYPLPLSSFIIGFFFSLFGTYGITAGSHRLWAHKAYKANRKMQYMLVFFQTIAGQNSCIEWVRDHRVHHKYSDTNADPHTISRGCFFAHIGWLLCKKHPDVRKYGARVDMSDLESDPLLRWQHKFYPILMPLLSIVFPIFLAWYLFDTPIAASYHWNMFRYALTLHITWSINSVSHLYGDKPFEKGIKSTDTYLIGILAFGEGWHNFHHVYPWDYKVSELPRYWCNFTIPFIDFFAWLGWATDLKTVSEEILRKRIARTGDGTHRYSKEAKKISDVNNNNSNQPQSEPVDLWGWDDNDMDPEERSDVTILHKKFGV